MKKFTGENAFAKRANDKRKENSEKIVNKLEEKYGYIDNEMMAAVVASFSFNESKSIRGCEGMKNEKSPISSVRVLGKNGNKLSIVAKDLNGKHRSGEVEKSRLFEILGINHDEANIAKVSEEYQEEK
ncbi:MAG: hypothetical protein IKE01_03845 [Clostridia bacterium]|nr:hypothetical protein [Clostridia bacterium]